MSGVGKIAVVTGAAGYLGSHTVEGLLARGYTVRGVDLAGASGSENLRACVEHPTFSLVECDLMDIPAADPVFADADFIFQCAAITDPALSMREPERIVTANLMTTLRCLEAARHGGKAKVIYPSSAAVYGVAQWPTREDHPVDTSHPYGFSKWMGEQAVLHWHRTFGVPGIVFRIFNGYGPRDLSPGVVGRFLKCRHAGEPIRILGDGSARRDFIYVGDIVDAFILGAESDKSGEIYNLASGSTRTVRELAELIGCAIEYGPARPGEPEVICADIAKIKHDLSWEPKVSLETGIAAALAYADGDFSFRRRPSPTGS